MARANIQGGTVVCLVAGDGGREHVSKVGGAHVLDVISNFPDDLGGLGEEHWAKQCEHYLTETSRKNNVTAVQTPDGSAMWLVTTRDIAQGTPLRYARGLAHQLSRACEADLAEGVQALFLQRERRVMGMAGAWGRAEVPVLAKCS